MSIFLIGIGFGPLLSAPFSGIFGRNAVYFASMIVVILFIMAKALAPNCGDALVFRLICALFAATPMTVAGGTIEDVWLPAQIIFALPSVMLTAYAGPILGPVVAAYTPEFDFRWADWISMIIVAAVLVLVLLLQPKTYAPTLLQWRAKHLRNLTGNSRYRIAHESTGSLKSRLLANSTRPFMMVWPEPIILIFSFHLMLLFFVLFTFLTGYAYIFTKPYSIPML